MSHVRIRHVAEGLGNRWGGTARVVTLLAKEQAIAGHDVEVLTLSQKDDDRDPADDLCFGKESRVGRLNVGPRRGTGPREKADIVHIHGLWRPQFWSEARMAGRKGELVVVSPHGMLLPAAFRTSRWKKWLAWIAYQRRLLRTVDALHATSTLEEAALRAFGFNQPIAVIPNPVDFNNVSLNPSKRLSELAGGKRIVLFLGRLHPIKGLDLLLRAWAKVGSTERKEWKLVLAGPDQDGYQRFLQKMVQRLNLEGEVLFPGPVGNLEKWEWYAGSDLVVLPSKSENFGLSAGEALVAEKPVLASHGTPWQDLERWGCGWWVSRNELAWVAALRVALGTDRSSLVAMGQRGRRVANDFTPKKVAASMLSFYDRLSVARPAVSGRLGRGDREVRSE